jgi:hypothetical protein
MASVGIRKRQTKTGASFQVRYRCGGRTFPLVHAGAFGTLRQAKTRRDFVAGELAAGRDPAEALRALSEARRRDVRTVTAWTEKFLASRIDIDANTADTYRSALRKAGEQLGGRDPHNDHGR